MDVGDVVRVVNPRRKKNVTALEGRAGVLIAQCASWCIPFWIVDLDQRPSKARSLGGISGVAIRESQLSKLVSTEFDN